MTKSKIRNALYNAAQWTWGLPQTLAGAGLYVKHRHEPHFNYNGAKVTAWSRDSGISLGKYIFVPRETVSNSEDKTDHGKNQPPEVSRFLLDHEYGHSLQSLILGPAYLLLVGVPSFAWNRLPYFARKRKKTGRSYYSAVFERTASHLGEKHGSKK